MSTGRGRVARAPPASFQGAQGRPCQAHLLQCGRLKKLAKLATT